MAAFSSSVHYHAPLLIDSSAPTTINNMCSSCLDQLSAGVEVADHRQNIIQVSDIGVCNEGPAYYSVITEKNKHNSNMDSSSLVCTKYNIESCSIHITTEKDAKMDKKRKSNGGSYLSNLPQLKEKKQKKVEDGEENKKKSKKEKKLAQAPTGYVHVRARRGQATASHSLAERVRREKISERMKLLQALVPGCQKVAGKALMLDEIINYVQSLQNQVEFLSMKLASVNPMLYDFGMDFESLMVKPDQELNSLLPYPLPTSMQTCSPTLTTANHYPIFMENSSANSLLFQHAHIPRALPDQGHRQVLWEINDQRHEIMNQTDICSTSFWSAFLSPSGKKK